VEGGGGGGGRVQRRGEKLREGKMLAQRHKLEKCLMQWKGTSSESDALQDVNRKQGMREERGGRRSR